MRLFGSITKSPQLYSLRIKLLLRRVFQYYGIGVEGHRIRKIKRNQLCLDKFGWIQAEDVALAEKGGPDEIYPLFLGPIGRLHERDIFPCPAGFSCVAQVLLRPVPLLIADSTYSVVCGFG